MKFIISLLILPIIALAQGNIERSAINTTGGEFTGSTLSVSYSVGETVVEIKSLPTVFITEGFQQPDADSMKVDVQFPESGISVKVYPNPGTDKLIIEFSEEQINVNVSVIDIKGNTLIKTDISGISKEISISDLSNGTYYLVLSIRNEIQKLKIVKIE